MYLFFDTETTGLPKDYKAPISDSNNWPRLVQLAWLWYDAEGNKWESYNYLVKPDGFVIPEEATKIHRISHDKAMADGQPLEDVLRHFAEEVRKADFVIGHNIDFDYKIIGAEFYRLNQSNVLDAANQVCTMKSSVDFCAIDNGYGRYKWPNLDQLHQRLFGQGFPEAHDALVDVEATARCFFALKEKGVIAY